MKEYLYLNELWKYVLGWNLTLIDTIYYDIDLTNRIKITPYWLQYQENLWAWFVDWAVVSFSALSNTEVAWVLLELNTLLNPYKYLKEWSYTCLEQSQLTNFLNTNLIKDHQFVVRNESSNIYLYYR